MRTALWDFRSDPVRAQPDGFSVFHPGTGDNREVDANSFGMTVELDGATVTVLNKAGLEAHLGVIDTARARPHGSGVVYRVKVQRSGRLAAFEERVAVRQVAGRLIVDPAPGQGAIYCFEEIR
jgi:hypothetical protein